MTSKKVFVFGIANDSIVDGPGLRWALFVQGCPFHCKNCHNKASLPFTKDNAYTVDELYSQITKNKIAKGVTFSGGEPLLQAEALIELASRIRDSRKELAIFTGFVWEEIFGYQKLPERVLNILDKEFPNFSSELDARLAKMQELVALADTLVDGRFDTVERDLRLRFKGSTNQRIIDTKKSLEMAEIVVRTEERWIPRG